MSQLAKGSDMKQPYFTDRPVTFIFATFVIGWLLFIFSSLWLDMKPKWLIIENQLVVKALAFPSQCPTVYTFLASIVGQCLQDLVLLQIIRWQRQLRSTNKPNQLQIKPNPSAPDLGESKNEANIHEQFIANLMSVILQFGHFTSF